MSNYKVTHKQQNYFPKASIVHIFIIKWNKTKCMLIIINYHLLHYNSPSIINILYSQLQLCIRKNVLKHYIFKIIIKILFVQYETSALNESLSYIQTVAVECKQYGTNKATTHLQ
jgi:hypothetical protein